jgi:hypothetical protein
MKNAAKPLVKFTKQQEEYYFEYCEKYITGKIYKQYFIFFVFYFIHTFFLFHFRKTKLFISKESIGIIILFFLFFLFILYRIFPKECKSQD